MPIHSLEIQGGPYLIPTCEKSKSRKVSSYSACMFPFSTEPEHLTGFSMFNLSILLCTREVLLSPIYIQGEKRYRESMSFMQVTQVFDWVGI